MEIITLPLKIDQYIKETYRDGTGIGYVVNQNPFDPRQLGVHLDLLNQKGKVYEKVEVYFEVNQHLSKPFQANGRDYRIMLTEVDLNEN